MAPIPMMILEPLGNFFILQHKCRLIDRKEKGNEQEFIG